jgi:hypothetical protein
MDKELILIKLRENNNTSQVFLTKIHSPKKNSYERNIPLYQRDCHTAIYEFMPMCLADKRGKKLLFGQVKDKFYEDHIFQDGRLIISW